MKNPRSMTVKLNLLFSQKEVLLKNGSFCELLCPAVHIFLILGPQTKYSRTEKSTGVDISIEIQYYGRKTL
jgi:hypothetical protein